MKRMISVLISTSLLLMSVPVFAISGTGTESNPYLISSASDIAKIHDDLDGYYKLTSNINMSGIEFEPIGNENEGAFTGTIDGNGYTISNLNINLPENKYVGFVGYLEGTIKNINITNVDAYGYRYVGGLVGYAEENGEMNNCSVEGDISGTYQIIGLNVGGIVGYNNGTIDTCNFKGYLESQRDTGGITTDNNGLITSCSSSAVISAVRYNIGGIATANNGIIENCINNSTFNTWGVYQGNVSVGGIVLSNNGKLINCVNNTNISFNGEDYVVVSGISVSSQGEIENCINYGNLLGWRCSGGICSYQSYGIVNSCINYGNVKGEFSTCYAGGILGQGGNNTTVKNCINYGKITSAGGNSWQSYVGGISASGGNASSCMNYGEIIASSEHGAYYLIPSGIIGTGGSVNNCFTISKTEISYIQPSITRPINEISFNELHQKNTFEDFDFDNIWCLDDCVHSGLPKLHNMPQHMELNECILMISTGSSSVLTASISGKKEDVEWLSDDVSIASVLSDGTIVANSAGICVITAKNNDGAKASCIVYVYSKANEIEMITNTVSIDSGEKYQLNAIQSPNGANESLYWYSEDENIASVTQTGMITGKAKGRTTIYAETANSKIRTNCTVTVSAPIIAIALSETNKTIKVGSSDVLTATLSPSDHDGDISWSSSDEEIITVEQTGRITAHKLGTAYITATATSGVTAQCKVTVNQPATNIKLNKSEVTTYVGSTYQLSASMLPLDTTDTVVYVESQWWDSKVDVSNTGLIKGKNVGTTTITATTSSGLSATCYVTVKAAQVMPASLTLSDTYITLAPEDAKALTHTFEPSNTTETTLTWTSSDENVATVDKNGVVTAIGEGFATIKSKTTNGLSHECVVKVVSASSPSVYLNSAKASPGDTVQLKVNLVKNPGISGYKFTVKYDESMLTPVKVTNNSEFDGSITTNLEDSNRTGLNIVWHSNDDTTVNGELFTIDFKVSDSAEYGDSSSVSLEYGAKDICNTAGEYFALYIDDATISIEEPLPGDVYEDGDITVYDLTTLARYITSLEEFTGRQIESADVNNDGLINILDVIRVGQYLVGWSGVELMSFEEPVVSVGTASVNNANEAEIPVLISNNVGILGYRFALDYNAEDIEILSITPSDLIDKDAFYTNLGADSQSDDGLMVTCFTTGNNVTEDGVLFTVKVRYKNPADTFVSPISIKDNFDNMGNQDANYVTATYETGYALGSDYIVANKVVGDTNFSCELYFDDSYAEQAAYVIIAFYDGDGRMVQLMPKDLTVKPGKVDVSIDYDKKAYATYKLMIWEGLNSLKPITDVK